MKRLFLLILIRIALPLTVHAQEPLADIPSERCFGLDFSNKKLPNGSRYLFETAWVKGELVSADNRFLRNDSILYSFDKLSQTLYLTIDKNIPYKVDSREFKSVTLYYHHSTFTFEHVEPINKKDLVQVIVKSHDKYSLYKLIDTRLAGNEYEDRYTYYILSPKMQFVRLNSLHKRAIMRAFAFSKDSGKANSFYSLHDEDPSDEEYLKKLIVYLNE